MQQHHGRTLAADSDVEAGADSKIATRMVVTYLNIWII
jgi:hypothetical protein